MAFDGRNPPIILTNVFFPLDGANRQHPAEMLKVEFCLVLIAVVTNLDLRVEMLSVRIEARLMS